jgi:hypothetical protein
MKAADMKLGYLMVTSPVPNVYIGGLMVTDARGLPVEFRYTEPIQPTKIQQVLYGQVLSAYIKREVILETLLKSMESRFKCLLIEDEHFLDYPAKGYSIVRVATTKSAPLGEVGKTQEIAPGEVLLQITAEGNPIRIGLSTVGPGKSKVPTESATPAAGEAAERDVKPDAISLLLEAGQAMDVTEPLKRIERALEIICAEAGITQAAASAR